MKYDSHICESAAKSQLSSLNRLRMRLRGLVCDESFFTLKPFSGLSLLNRYWDLLGRVTFIRFYYFSSVTCVGRTGLIYTAAPIEMVCLQSCNPLGTWGTIYSAAIIEMVCLQFRNPLGT